MKVMVLVKATQDSEEGKMPGETLMREMGEFNEQLIAAGVMVTGDGLHPSSRGFRVRFSGKDRTVQPGPFPHTNELVAGFWVWNVASLEEAIEWVKRCPNPMLVDSEIEIRKIYDFDEFAPATSAEE